MPTPVPQQAAPVAIERPFDVNPTSPGIDPRLPPLPLHPPTTTTNGKQPLYEAETPLAYPDDHHPNNPPLPNTNIAPHHDQDEPSDFEWRNLKKLTVLVLSSLIWKNRTVQDQVRRYGGLEALVGCCRPDEHNPYIREHAIMCLRFAVEGCEENGRVIRSMAEGHPGRKKAPVAIEGGNITPSSVGAAIEDVPREVLDTQGYETFVDPKGQVGLRRKDVGMSGPSHPPQQQQGHSQNSAGVTKPRLSSTKLTAERAAELMSSALSSLPIGDKLVDKGKLEALSKLDRAFEKSERDRNG